MLNANGGMATDCPFSSKKLTTSEERPVTFIAGSLLPHGQGSGRRMIPSP